MSIDTQNLRHAAASIRAFLKPEYAREIALAADYIDAQEAEIERLRERLQGASNYIDTLGGVSKEYRAALSGEPT